METRQTFVTLASQPGANVSELCRRFNISRKSGYKWLQRFRAGPADVAVLANRSRRPKQSPGLTDEAVVQRLLALREEHPAWGPRKLRRALQDQGLADVPACSTIGSLLRRHGYIDPAQSQAHRPYVRFERAQPNELWQMDFKGDFALSRGGRCHPFGVVDDHSRFLLGLFACANQQEGTVRGHLEAVFERYGLPEEILCDNGSPWGGYYAGSWTELRVWLLRHGVWMLHGRPYHPQTQGKQERFHRSLKAEVLQRRDLADLAEAGAAFRQWREVYNLERPHEALGLAVPAQRYRMSARRWCAQLPPLEYGPADEVRKVTGQGSFGFQGRQYFLGAAFGGQPIALRRTAQDGVWDVCYGAHPLGSLDVRAPGEPGTRYGGLLPRRAAPALAEAVGA